MAKTVVRISLDWTRLTIDTTTDTFIPRTGWQETNGETYSARGFCEMRARTSSPGLLASPCVQLANDIRSPASTTQVQIDGGDVNGFANANGYFDPDAGGPQTITTQGYRFMRFGWVIKSASSGSSGADCAGGVELRA